METIIELNQIKINQYISKAHKISSKNLSFWELAEKKILDLIFIQSSSFTNWNVK